MTEFSQQQPTDRRALLAGIGGLAAGTFLSAGRANAGSLTPPGAPTPTGKPLAEVEPRVAVNDANTPTDGFAAHLISQPGSYYLTGNIAFGPEKAGVLIEASNVTLDLNGFSIIGAGSSSSAAGVAVASERTDVMVHNGFISDCRHAVYGEESPGRILVRNVRVRNTQFEAIFLPNTSFAEDCSVINTGGIKVGELCRVARCHVRVCNDVGIYAGPGSVVVENNVSETQKDGITVSSNCVVESNHVLGGLQAGIRIPSGIGSVVRNNTVLSNALWGLRVDGSGHTISGNTVRLCDTNYHFSAGNHLDLLISQIPQTLSWPCSAKLQGTLTGFADLHGITIASDDVTVDLGGHALIGGGGTEPRSGIHVQPDENHYNITVRNGTLRGWRGFGVSALNVRPFIAHEVSAVANHLGGFELGSSIATMTRCVAQLSAGPGFGSSGNGSLFVHCTAATCNAGFTLGGRATVHTCTATLNFGSGIALLGGGVVTDATASDNSGAGFLGINTTFSGCSALNNQTGFEVTEGLVSGCHAVGNGLYGINARQAIVAGNNVKGNGGDLPGAGPEVGGIYARMGSRIEGNYCVENARGVAIPESQQCIVIRNTSRNNGLNWVIRQGNAVAPIVQATLNGAFISGDTYSGSLGSTDPNANFTH